MAKFFLVAQGSVTHPKLDISVPGSKLDNAVEYAADMVKVLMLAGYYRFNLYDTDDMEVVAGFSKGPRHVCTYGIEKPEVRVTPVLSK